MILLKMIDSKTFDRIHKSLHGYSPVSVVCRLTEVEIARHPHIPPPRCIGVRAASGRHTVQFRIDLVSHFDETCLPAVFPGSSASVTSTLRWKNRTTLRSVPMVILWLNTQVWTIRLVTVSPFSNTSS